MRDVIDEWRAEEDEERMDDRRGYRSENQGENRSLNSIRQGNIVSILVS